jgi:acetyl esterase/lipase
LLNQPCLDDRQQTWSARNFTETPLVVSRQNHGRMGALPGLRAWPYAAPARATDLTGLPSAYIGTAEFDPLRDEGICHALRLLQAACVWSCTQWPGTFNGSQAVMSAEVSQRQIAELTGALCRALAE